MLISDAVRNVVYPGVFFLGIGSLWTFAWAVKQADSPDHLAPIPGMAERFRQSAGESPEQHSIFAPPSNSNPLVISNLDTK